MRYCSGVRRSRHSASERTSIGHFHRAGELAVGANHSNTHVRHAAFSFGLGRGLVAAAASIGPPQPAAIRRTIDNRELVCGSHFGISSRLPQGAMRLSFSHRNYTRQHARIKWGGIPPYRSPAGARPISFPCRRRLPSPIRGVLSPCGDESASGDASYNSYLHKRIGPAVWVTAKMAVLRRTLRSSWGTSHDADDRQ